MSGCCETPAGSLPRARMWEQYTPKQKAGKLCYYLCSTKSDTPVRNAPEKKEPNYETKTYNSCASCNQRSVQAAINNRVSHIFFVTRYTGTLKKYRGRCFIVGFYEIGQTRRIGKRSSIKASQIYFVSIEKAYEVNRKTWRRINRNGMTKDLVNLRHATQRIDGNLFEKILSCLTAGKDISNKYSREVARLKRIAIPGLCCNEDAKRGRRNDQR